MKLLDAGANDYVTKPFSVQELVARIRVLLRQHQHSTVDTVIFDDGVLKIDFSKRQVFKSTIALLNTQRISAAEFIGEK